MYQGYRAHIEGTVRMTPDNEVRWKYVSLGP